MKQRVLPRAARERWLKGDPAIALPRDEGTVTYWVEPVSENGTRHLMAKVTMRPGATPGEPWDTVEPEYHWSFLRGATNITRVRLYSEDAEELLVDSEMIEPLHVDQGQTFKFDGRTFVLTG